MGEDGKRLPIVGQVVEFPMPGEYLRLDFLTRPRWTLERLLSEPPEGWKVLRRPDYRHDHWEAVWTWGRHLSATGSLQDVYEVKFRLFSNGNKASDVWAASDGARLAERHKAAAEFALILAEVAP